MDEEEIIQEPKIGMTFKSSEEAYDYYLNYGKQKGFGVVKRTSKRDDDGNVKYIASACSKTRKRQLESNSFTSTRVTKTGCKAKIRLILCDDGQYQISGVELDHDHVLSPGKARHFRCNRKLSENVKRRLEINDEAGIGASKNYHSLVVEAGGYENVTFNEKDCRNYIEKARQTRLGAGDAEAVCKYFAKMQEADPNFFHMVDVDENSRIRNLFWADGRSRAAYEVFGDVITFDATYLTNKYDMPFAPFVGVNHHGQSVLFGCGLLTKENTDSFVWLFQSWLNCMSRLHPKAIITDQCKAMQNAIEIVFPNVRHRLCLWHIMNKLPEKLRGYTDYEEIKQVLQTVVYDSSTESEFENGWSLMIESHNLSGNEWLGGLYRERQRWVPAYVKSSFWAGMSTTQRSESINSFFKGYVSHKTTLKQFVELYDTALKSKVEKENLADYQSFNSWYECLSDYEIEKQFQRVYTNAKFKEFQDELKGKFYCNPSLVKTENLIYEYKVVEDVKVGEKREYIAFLVHFNEVDCEMNSDFEDKYELVLKGIEELKAKVANDELIDNRTIQRSASPSQSCADNRVPSRTNKVLSPLVTRRRGRPSTKRKIPRIEEVIRKLKNKKKVQQVKENIGSKKSRTKKNHQQRKEVEKCEDTCLSSQNYNEMQSLESFNLMESRTAGEYCMFTPLNLGATSINTSFEVNQAPLFRGYYPPTPFAPNIYHSSQENVMGFQGYINQSRSGVYGGTQQTIPSINFPQENPYTFESSKDHYPKM
ncbi:hypothetical protein CCACVL1_15958 [Corchorus capsularis]|uniref:Uncharacterized protein n=1 Tax=Corchorus capsularis TaxID=210143 RepID=A0A1R3I092_COCAP|nr:hypothetical protein CCACVL1_15958 [Corchorus capsularis]